MILNIEDQISNFCTDLLSLRKNEWFLKYLFKKSNGQWVEMSEAFLKNGKQMPENYKFKSKLFAVWLHDPFGDQDFVMIFFYYDEIGWSMSASYNRSRLLRDRANEDG
jgi:hypothetical protein